MEEDLNKIPIVMIDVFSDRGLSMEIAAHLSLRHESPQIIYLEKGKMLWNDSHLAVTSKEITTATKSSDSV